MNTSSNLNRREFASAAALTLAMPGLLLPHRARSAEPVIAEVQHGRLGGLRDGGAVSFKGIPYAADTGGANRFMAPRPVVPWTGVREAIRFGDRCPQTGGGGMGQMSVFTWYAQDSAFSENCCVLNVYAPDLNAGARRPVMVWLHGGGFSGGGGGGAGIDGSNLARTGDVVVVTLNHRLNVFGYTNLGHLDAQFADAANVGQLDIIAALTWVKDNIHVFGGDARNVTLFGQSGGGSKITALMVMPGARGLFRQAINMSGVSAFGIGPAARTEPLTNELLKSLGIEPRNLRRLQEVPADKLRAAHDTAVRTLDTDESRPVIDGRHILAGPLSPQGLALNASVPLLVGTTDTEATLFLGRDKRNFEVTLPQLKARLKAQFKLDDARTDAVVAAYANADPRRTPADILALLASDVLFRGRMLQGIDAKANAGQAPVYVYNFVWRMPVEGGVWRTPHASDIPFAFANVDRARMMTGPGPAPKEVEASMTAAFLAFARTGNPDNARMPRWPRYDVRTRPSMVIDQRCRVVNDFQGAERLACADLLDQDSSQLQRGPLFRVDG